MSEMLYLQTERNIKITSPVVTLGDVAQLSCSDGAVIARNQVRRVAHLPDDWAISSSSRTVIVCPDVHLQTLTLMPWKMMRMFWAETSVRNCRITCVKHRQFVHS